MQWTPSATAKLARHGCPYCQGTGRIGSIEPKELCNCIYRAVFRACHNRFRNCEAAARSVRSVRFERISGAVDRSLTWVRSAEDYRADFHSCGLRALPRDLYQYFSFYYLHGGNQDIVCRRLNISMRLADTWMGDIETLVGKEIAHLKPYSLFPPHGYRIPVRRALSVEAHLRRAS